MKKIYFIALTLLLGIAQDAWAATTGNWQNNCDASWGSDYSTSSSFTISTAAQLAKFASIVNAGNNFSGKTITLAEDIDLSEHYWLPIGVYESYSFNGSFDGAGHTISGMYINETRLCNGLFGYINGGAGIRNLKLTDSRINANSNFTGAIVGYARSGKIQNCSVASSVEVTSSAAQSGDGEEIITTGGLVGRIMSSSEMTGCVCGAAVSGTEKVGGLAGEEVSANIVACLYTGSSVNGGSSTTQAALFGNINGGDHLYHNLYTNSALDGKNGQDRRGYVISLPSGVTFDFFSQAQSNYDYDVSDITLYTYPNWPYTNYSLIIYGGTMYCALGQRIPFTVTTPPGYALTSGVSVPDGYEGYITDTYTLVTGASDCQLIAPTALTAWNGNEKGTELDPYIIRTQYDLQWVSVYTNTSADDHYEGKYLQLGNDIAFDGTANNFTAIGNNISSRYFAGTFDGQGYTISGINLGANGGQGLFGAVNGGTVKNLTLSSSTIKSTSNSSAGGIVASAGNNGVTIENCHVSGSVVIESGNDSGGIIGKTNAGDVSITGCTSGATVTTRNSSSCAAGIIGFCGRETSSPTTNVSISDCLYYGSSLSGDPTKTGGIVGCLYVNTSNNSSKVTLSNNFYTYPTTSVKGTGQWKEKYSSAYDRTHDAGDIFRNTILGNNINGAVRAHVVSASADIEDMGAAGTPVENGITPYAYGVKFGNTYYSHVLALLNNADNTELISQYAGQTFNVKLRGRTLYKDGAWNTLCLPFNQTSFAGTIFEDASQYEKLEMDVSRSYSSSGSTDIYRTGCQDGKLYLFFKNANDIEAGKPYIVKWEKVDGYDNHHDPETYDYVDPMFPNVTLVGGSPATVTSEDGTVSFTPTYAPISRDYEDRSLLLIGISNSLYYPNGAGTVSLKSFRAYFQLNGVLMHESPSSSVGDDDDDNYIPIGGGEAKAFVLDIEDDATSLDEELRMKSDESAGAGEWYSLDGIRLNSKPSLKDIYVTGGRKVVIK
jgi:hypothetical protein